jgi:hypothetical protein
MEVPHGQRNGGGGPALTSRQRPKADERVGRRLSAPYGCIPVRIGEKVGSDRWAQDYRAQV